MAKTLKGTRARGLPPKLLLSRKQDATGSFPTVWRTASDNRTGKYPVFFNDNKVVSFNQPVTDAGFFVTTYPEYEEKVVVVGSPGNPTNESDPIVFDNSFSGTPIVVITEITSNPNTPMVNAFVSVMSATGSIIGFSAPFEGTFVYRAIYQPAYGNPVNVLRSPRYTDQYSLVVAENNIMSSNTSYVTFSDFGSTPTENYVTFWDYNGPPNNTGANLSGSVNSTYITNTSVQVTASAQGGGSTVLHYMGVGTSTASIDVKGIVYPLVMTPQAINAGLSTEDISALYKQPYFSGSEIVNQPIITSGSMVKGVSDTFVTFTPGQDVEPFMDFANPEGDAKSLPVTSSTYQFYATGSAVTTTGIGFQQPLWSKNKIEIDITPATPQTISLSNTGSSGNYPVNYWNPNTKQYEGMGSGRGLWSGFGNTAPSNTAAIQGLLEDQMYGFGASIDTGIPAYEITSEKTNVYARQISTFGFPYHSKFQPTSSQQIEMNEYISEPFLLEKLVLEFSGSLQTKHPSYGTDSAIWTFFVLNSRFTVPNKPSEPQIIQYKDFSFVPVYDTFTTSSFVKSSYLDLIDYFQIAFTGSLSNQLQAINRELIVTPTELGMPRRYVYSNQMNVSSSIKSSLKYDGSGFYATINSANTILVASQSLNVSGRNQLFNANGRDWKTTFESNILSGITMSSLPGVLDAIETNVLYTKPNPYILLPTDKITFGFQLPWSSTMGFSNYSVTSSIGFATTGINKIILYGSTLRLNPETNQLEEHHDTLNQLLCSNSVHEVIGE